MKDFRRRLAEGVILGDGALGTQLTARGLRAGSPPERWTLEKPEVLAEIASRYVDAGAELITTNTFGGSPIRLAQHGLADRFEEVNRRAVEIVRAAAGDRAWVSASIGPTGKLLEPFGDAVPDEVAAGFERQARLLVEAGADLVCIETMTDLQEALLAVRAVRAVSASIPLIATMTFDITPRGPFTIMGVPVATAAAELAAAGADVVGANCGAGVNEMLVVARAFLASASIPVAIQPNAGLPRKVDGRLDYPEAPSEFAHALAPLTDEGVKILGGCCGTTPEHIGALALIIKRQVEGF